MAILSMQRKSKVRFYARSFFEHLLVPNAYFRHHLAQKLSGIERYDPEGILDRVQYYNKSEAPFKVTGDALDLESIPSDKQTAYYYDLRALLRYFPKNCRVDYQFGDIRDTADVPTLVKSRTIGIDNGNNIMLKLNGVRHFMPIRDRVPYKEKKDLLVWRGAGWQQHRKDFLVKFWNHPLCDVGMVNEPRHGDKQEWVKPKMTVAEQLQYKFILSIEGNDVATNLKWIAQSNSLCFMTRPKYETWMMEGRLVPGKHYVELRDDYLDLAEKVKYYTQNKEESLAVINNMQEYYKPFMDAAREELISLMVLQKYLNLSGQLNPV